MKAGPEGQARVTRRACPWQLSRLTSETEQRLPASLVPELEVQVAVSRHAWGGMKPCSSKTFQHFSTS
jgi:hypothetical protein